MLPDRFIEFFLIHAGYLQIIIQHFRPLRIDSIGQFKTFISGQYTIPYICAGLNGSLPPTTLQIAGEVMNSGHYALRTLVALIGIF